MIHELDVQKEYKSDSTRWIAGRYYDRPDGEDLLGKLLFTTKIAGYAGVIGGLIASRYPTKARNLLENVVRTSQILIPCLGMAITFTTVTFFATRIRQKDDQINYILGGAAAGSLLGPATGNRSIGIAAAVVCAIAGFGKKQAELYNVKTLHSFKHQYFPSYYRRNMDTSLVSDRKGNWTKEPKPE